MLRHLAPVAVLAMVAGPSLAATPGAVTTRTHKVIKPTKVKTVKTVKVTKATKTSS